MQLTLAQRIALDRLLLDREEQWLRVFACEQAIEAILGQPFPFPPPPDLPSAQKRTSARKPKKAKDRKESRPAPSLPRLLSDETGFHVVYRLDDEIVTEDHLDPKALETWLAQRPQAVQPLRIHAMDSHGAPGRLLWEADPESTSDHFPEGLML